MILGRKGEWSYECSDLLTTSVCFFLCLCFFLLDGIYSETKRRVSGSDGRPSPVMPGEVGNNAGRFRGNRKRGQGGRGSSLFFFFSEKAEVGVAGSSWLHAKARRSGAEGGAVGGWLGPVDVLSLEQNSTAVRVGFSAMIKRRNDEIHHLRRKRFESAAPRAGRFSFQLEAAIQNRCAICLRRGVARSGQGTKAEWTGDSCVRRTDDPQSPRRLARELGLTRRGWRKTKGENGNMKRGLRGVGGWMGIGTETRLFRLSTYWACFGAHLVATAREKHQMGPSWRMFRDRAMDWRLAGTRQ